MLCFEKKNEIKVFKFLEFIYNFRKHTADKICVFLLGEKEIIFIKKKHLSFVLSVVFTKKAQRTLPTI